MKQVNPRIYRTILTLVLGLFLSVGAYAQNITVKGTVTDATGEPVIGANVLEKGTTNGVITLMVIFSCKPLVVQYFRSLLSVS